MTHFAPVRFYKQTTLRTETFTQSSLYAQILLHREVCAQINFYNQTPLHTFLLKEVLHTEVFIHRCFAQRCMYKSLFHRLRPSYPQMHLHRKTFAHSTLLHTASFHTGRLCFHFLITCSPSQVHHRFQKKHLQGGAP